MSDTEKAIPTPKQRIDRAMANMPYISAFGLKKVSDQADDQQALGLTALHLERLSDLMRERAAGHQLLMQEIETLRNERATVRRFLGLDSLATDIAKIKHTLCRPD